MLLGLAMLKENSTRIYIYIYIYIITKVQIVEGPKWRMLRGLCTIIISR